MRFSQVLKSSPHCLPSPDGKLIATLLPGNISIRAVESLDIVRNVRLPADLNGAITTFVWSPSSGKLLLGANDEIHVFSALGTEYHATIRNPSSSVAKSTFVDFGATDREVCVLSAYGIKLSIFDLASTKVIEVNNPKFYTASTAARGFSFRPRSHHLALLTRNAGKDSISIHQPVTREIERSWTPDLVDAQGLDWTPDGRWLVVWESPAQGHKLQIYTPDGHKYRDWCGSFPDTSVDIDHRLGAGIKSIAFSPNSQYVAIGNYDRCVYVLHMTNMTEQLQLQHPLIIEPKDTLQVWQEQINGSAAAVTVPTFIKASQPVSPATRSPASTKDLTSGPHILQFDCSAALLVVVREETPTTLYIWDVSASELRAVLMFHTQILRVDWHPTQPELLFLRCDGDGHNGIVYTWDPLSGGPRLVDFRSSMPENKIIGKSVALWLKASVEPACLFFADTQVYVLCSLGDTQDSILPWQIVSDSMEPGESLLQGGSQTAAGRADEFNDLDEGGSELDDTFHFKKFQAD